MTEVARFRAWDDSIPIPHASRYGEWECDYESWPALYEAVLGFVADRPFASWSEAELRAILYAIARDNEMQHLAREIRKRHPEILQPLARAAHQMGERDDRWQLAVELGHLGKDAEPLLLELARDEHEYVRRLALKALLDIGSSAVEQLSLAAWNRPDEQQEWARMMALFCLRKLGSRHLAPLLAEAETDSRKHLREYAERIHRGESLD
jgi:HEAT repeat protein